MREGVELVERAKHARYTMEQPTALLAVGNDDAQHSW